MSLALLPFQEEALAFLLSSLRERGRRRARVLAFDVGLGKTATGAASADLLAEETGRGGLIVCPASLRTVWRDELRKWGSTLRIMTPTSGTGVRAPEVGEVLIVSYDTLGALGSKKPTRGKKPKNSTAEEDVKREAAFEKRLALWQTRSWTWHGLLSWASRIGWVIADELQKIRAAGSTRSIVFEPLRERVVAGGGVVLSLTGTPIENSPLDLWIELVRLGIDAEIFPGGIADFAHHFGGIFDTYSGRWTFPPVPPGGSIYSRLVDSGLFMIKSASEAASESGHLPALPPKTYKATLCPVDGATATLGRLFAEALGVRPEALAGNEVVDIEAKARGAGLLGELSRLRKESASAKVPTLLRRLDELGDSEGPIVVYSEHVAPIEALRGREGWTVITGAETPSQRAERARDFQAGKYKGIGITSAVREGWTLTRAHYLIRVSFSWLYKWEEQSEARVWRLGQIHPVTVETLVADHPIERALLRRLTEGRIRGEETWRRPAALVADL